jgi:hypothetical protein
MIPLAQTLKSAPPVLYGPPGLCFATDITLT